jgi:2Fe-2S ferredoxin
MEKELMHVNYIEPSGQFKTVEGEAGASVMSTAKKRGVVGIEAECGGFMSCATCHVYVDPEWIDRVGRAEDLVDDTEDELLEGTVCPRESTSRLSCQIKLDDALDGITVRIPAEQS